MATVGSGDFKYERAPSWPKLPKHWAMGMASDGAVNSHNEIHIFSRGDHPVTIWDPDGNFISSWGEGTFSANPHGIYIAPNDNVWLVDRDYHIATEYTPAGKPLRTLGNKLSPSPSFQGMPFNMPSGLAIAPDGNMFVSDGYGGHRVHKFSPDGKLLKSWGMEGAGHGTFKLLHNVWVDSRNRVFICDRENDLIQIFDSEGNFLEEWSDVTRPGDMYIQDETIFVIESGPGGGVSIWTLDHELITRWKSNEPSEGSIIGGHGICVDLDLNIYVTEIGRGQRVTKFQKV